MKKTGILVTLAATALAALVVTASSIAPAAARQGGHSFSGGGRSGGGSARSFSGGSRSYSGGTRQFSRTFRSPSGGSSRVYAYRSHGAHRGHHRRGGVFVYGYPYGDYYAYSDSCTWLRRRALTTGSSYWWNRYYDCIDDY